MFFRVEETKELKKINYIVNGHDCAAEIIGSYSWDAFTEINGVLVCSQATFDQWSQYFEELVRVGKS